MDYKTYLVRSGSIDIGMHIFLMRLPANAKPLDIWNAADDNAMYNVTSVEEVTFSEQGTFFITSI